MDDKFVQRCGAALVFFRLVCSAVRLVQRVLMCFWTCLLLLLSVAAFHSAVLPLSFCSPLSLLSPLFDHVSPVSLAVSTASVP